MNYAHTFLLLNITCAPCFARFSAIPRPMPSVEAVTMATFPDNFPDGAADGEEVLKDEALELSIPRLL